MSFFDTKIKKLLVGKYYGNFKNLFRGSGIDIKDFKQYETGDDTRHINWKLSIKHEKLFLNVLGEQKDTDIDLFLDVNKNFDAGINQKNIDKVFEFTKDLFLYAKRFGANLNGFHFQDQKLSYCKLKDEYDLFSFLTKINKISKKNDFVYKSNLDIFVKRQKNTSKKHMIIIISDFLDMNQEFIKTIKLLKLKNEVFLLKIDVDLSVGKNFDTFDIAKSGDKNGLKFIDLT